MLLTAIDLTKVYEGGEAPVPALRGVSVSVGAGEFVALTGPSGCGKSTLLHLCGAMDRPSSGDITFEGRSLRTLDDEELTRLRRSRIGFVFQFFNLLPTLTVAENIALPLMLDGASSGRAHGHALALAERVGVGHRLRHYPQQLSGGEMQRVAIARAVVHRPALLIADEPTGNLDSRNGERVLELLRELNAEMGVGMVLATHDADVASAAHRTLHMHDGVIERVDEPRAGGVREGGAD
jgi:putative ABC transport system ATP-binding protein